MQEYITIGAILNELDPVLSAHNIEIELVEDNNIREWACYRFAGDIDLHKMLAYLEEADLVPGITPIKEEDLRKGNIRRKLWKDDAHLAYPSETDNLVIRIEDKE